MLCLALLGGAACGRSPEAPSRPNVLVLLVDALRADRLSCYGAPSGLTPEIDRLAQHGVRFTRAYANAPSTVASVASLFTATPPPVHRITAAPTDTEEEELSALPEAYLSAPEVFQAHGYRTFMITTSGWVTPEAGYGQGVDEYLLTERADREVIAATIELLRRPPQEPFFLYAHLLDLHDYYHSDALFPPGVPLPDGISDALRGLRGQTPSQIYRALRSEPGRFTPADARFLLATYDRRLRDTDRLIGRLLSALRDTGLRQRTLVVLTADHGEQFLEHGHLVHGGDGFYDEVLRVPLIMATPDGARTGTEDTLTSLIDVVPTLLDLLGLDRPAPYQGRSVFAPERLDRPVLATNGRTWKLVDQRWSYIFSRRYEREELFDLQEDPGESRNLIEREAPVAAEMRRLLASQLRESRRHPYVTEVTTIPRVQMSDQVTGTLRSLGYLD